MSSVMAATTENDETLSVNRGGNADKVLDTLDKPPHPGATLEARPNKDGLAVKRGMKGKSKPLHFWTAADVNKWLRKHGGQYYELYGDLLVEHEVTGRTLIRMNDIKLEKLGVLDATHRHDLLHSILLLRIKHDVPDLRDLKERGTGFELKLPDNRSQNDKPSPSSSSYATLSVNPNRH